MLTEVIKEAFEEGRQFGGEWEDSDAKVVSELLSFGDINNVKIRQRTLDGKFGITFNNMKEVREYVRNVLNETFNGSNFQAALLGGWKQHGFRWEVVV